LGLFSATPWGIGLGLAGSLGSMLASRNMPNGYDVGNRAFGNMMSDGYRMSQTMLPGMANSYYASMMGGPMGRALRLNSMQAGRAAQAGVGNALAGSGLMHSGGGIKMRGLSNAVGFNQLSQGQSALNSLAWQQAGNNFNQMFGGALGYGNQMGMMADQRKWGLMGAGFGGLGSLATGLLK